MVFQGICLITRDVPRLRAFYTQLLRCSYEGDDIHTALDTQGAPIAIYSRDAAISDMGFSFPPDAGCGMLTLSFRVDDVDAEYERLLSLNAECVLPPKDYPWGSRSAHFRDPDGNIVTLVCRLS